MLLRELPPTAGLPLKMRDLISGVSAGNFGSLKNFEESLAAFLEYPEIDLFSSGSLCLSIAFEALKELTGRKRIIIPAYTCPLVPIAAHAAGVEVVLCDTKAGTCEFDLEMLQSLCDTTIAAIVPTDIAGLPVDISAVKNLARSVSAFVVEDAAQALGGRINGKPVGREADMAIYSLSVGKGLSLYDGGILAVTDPELRKAVRRIAARRIKLQPHMNLLRWVQMLGMYMLYNPSCLPYVYGHDLGRHLQKGDLIGAVGEHFDFDIPAYKYDGLRKQIGSSALRRLPEFVSRNRLRGIARKQYLTKQAGFDVLDESPEAEGTWPFLMVLAESETQRDRIMEKLWLSGMGVTRLFIHELSSYDYLREIVPQQAMPNARDFAQRSFTITNSHWLSEFEFAAIVRTLAAEKVLTQPLTSVVLR